MKNAEMVLELDRESADNWNLKGNVQLLHGRYHEAEDSFTEALTRDPNLIEALYNRGLARLMSYRPLQGCHDLQRCIDEAFDPARKTFENFCGF